MSILLVSYLQECNNSDGGKSMKEVVQVELSGEEDKIVQIYRLEHNKKSNADAIKDIIKQYKPLNEYKEKNKVKNKRNWWSI
jgi:hypothetical protein